FLALTSLRTSHNRKQIPNLLASVGALFNPEEEVAVDEQQKDEQRKLNDDAELVRAALSLEQFEIRLGVPLTNTGLRPLSFYATQNHPAARAEKTKVAAKPQQNARENTCEDQEDPEKDYQLHSSLRNDT